ncbi:MAG: replicative DNA helicase [Coriobacteriales bacterium]|nr:replicative DNA helicase [Coriobacteriales bacterium]
MADQKRKPSSDRIGDDDFGYDSAEALVLSNPIPDPHNLEAEQAVLAAMILDSDIVEEALGRIRVNDFYRGAHSRIFNAIYDLSMRHIPVDPISVADRLESLGDLDMAGGRSYLVQLANNATAVYNWEHHAGIVRRYSLLRELMKAARNIEALAESPLDDSEEIIEQAEKLIFDVTQERVESDFQQINELLITTGRMIEEQSKNQHRFQGILSGFEELDELLTGFRGGDLIILAARPSVGKSTLALNIAMNATKEGVTVLFYSLEMPSDQLTMRIISSEAQVDHGRLRTANLEDYDWTNINAASSSLYECKMFIEDNPSLNLMQLRAKSRRQLRGMERDKGLIVIDYLQLMQPTRSGHERQRYIEVAEMTRGLKILAKELNVPIIALSQLSRNVEMRTDKRPQLSDLRESGSIEQDADVVLFVDRALRWEKDDNDEDFSGGDADKHSKRLPPDRARLIVGKNRNGTTGIVEVAFDESYSRFREIAKERGALMG